MRQLEEASQRSLAVATQGFGRLESEARRAGTGVAAGIEIGTVSLNKMVAAGIAAFTAIKTVQGALRDLEHAVAAGSETGRQAQFAGISPRFTSTFSAGLRSLMNVDQAQTQEAIFQMSQFAERLALGQLDEGQMRALARIPGASEAATDRRLSPEERVRRVMEAEQRAFQQMTEPEAQALGAQLGQGRALISGLRQFGPQGILGEGAKFVPPDVGQQYEMFRKLQQAVNDVELAWNKLINRMVSDHPELIQLVNTLKDWLLELEKNPAALKRVEEALGAFVAFAGIALGVRLVGIFQAASATILKTPLGAFLLGGYLASQAMSGPGTPHAEGTKPWHERSTLENLQEGLKETWSLLTGRGGYTEGTGPAPPSDDRPWWKRVLGIGEPTGEGRQGAATTPSGETFYTGSARGPVAETTGFNVGGLRHPAGGFRTYPSEYAGTADTARLLRRYGQEGQDTLESIITKWAPPSENDTALLIQRAEQWTGWSRNQKLNLEDPQTLATMVDVMQRNERGGNRLVSAANVQQHVRQYLTSGGATNARFSAGTVNLGQVDDTLVSSLRTAASTLPPGYRVVATSGAREGGLSGSQHHGGHALDVKIVGPSGEELPNRGEDTSGMYAQLAHAWYASLPPELQARAGWGGEFETSPGSGTPDLMHFDFGGRRGRFARNDWAFADKAARPPSSYWSHFGLISEARAAEGGGAAPTTVNHGDVTTGDIHVHTHATDAGGISAGIAHELRRQLHTTNANTGLEVLIGFSPILAIIAQFLNGGILG